MPSRDQSPAPISDLVSGFPGISVTKLDGCDYFASRAAGAAAVAGVRAGRGPALLHATVTRPYSHSSSDTQARYRLAADIDAERARDPLRRLERELVEAGVLSEDDAAAMRTEAHDLAAEASAKAVDAARPDPATVREHVVSRASACPSRPRPARPAASRCTSARRSAGPSTS